MAGLSGVAAMFVNLAVAATIYAILSLGLNLQWGYTGLFNISVAAFWGIGAYTAAIVTKSASADTAFGFDLPYLWVDVHGIPVPMPIAVFLAGTVCAVVAALIGIPTLRLRADYLAIATLGLAEIIRLILLNEAWLTEGGQGTVVENPILGGDYSGVVLLVISLVALVVIYWILERAINSPWGRVLKAIRDDEEVASALGKNAFSFKMQAFVLGSVIMGVAGTLTALRINFLIPKQFNPEWTFFVWIAVLLGGSGSNRGAVLGGAVLAVLLQLPRYLDGIVPIANFAANARLFIIGLLIIIIMSYRPQGLLGEYAPERT